MAGRLEWGVDPVEASVRLSEGIPGAAIVCIECFKSTKTIDPDAGLEGLSLLYHFDDNAHSILFSKVNPTAAEKDAMNTEVDRAFTGDFDPFQCALIAMRFYQKEVNKK